MIKDTRRNRRVPGHANVAGLLLNYLVPWWILGIVIEVLETNQKDWIDSPASLKVDTCGRNNP